MRKNPHPRHPKLKDVPHPSEHKNEDGSINMTSMEDSVAGILAVIRSGKIEIKDADLTDPDPVTNEFYAIYRCKVK